MSAPRFFIQQELAAGAELELSAEAANHVRVLRLQPGQAITLFNGQGGEYSATLLTLERRRVWVRIETHHAQDAESPLNITLIQGISKGERMDFTVQKAVELGVSTIQPVFTEYTVVQLNSERRSRRQQHWQNIAIAACQQCGRNTIPDILPPLPLQEVWATLPAAQQRLVLDPEGQQRLRDLTVASSIALLVGPEGGLSEAEVSAAETEQFSRLRLGPRLLRTETAGPAAIAALQALHGDL